jgi:hypothetical protein
MKTNQVAANGKSMVSLLPICALVSRLKFHKLLVRSFSQLLWEGRVDLTGVAEQWRFALLGVDLLAHQSICTQTHLRTAHIEILQLEKGREFNNRDTNDVLESKVKHEASWKKVMVPRTRQS